VGICEIETCEHSDHPFANLHTVSIILFGGVAANLKLGSRRLIFGSDVEAYRLAPQVQAL
jgi:hypothetical protein